MIYVHFDMTQLSVSDRTALADAASELDKITTKQERKEFIKANQHLWAAVRAGLAAMSHNKCWYSEARERVSRYQVDHFRPHGRAKQAERDYAEGYCWLAFDLENFRIAGVLVNTVNREHSDGSVGKGDWFPLLDPAMRATLANRDTTRETPILLDPTDPDDPPKLQFNDDGSAAPDDSLERQEWERVSSAILMLGLDQAVLNEARRGVWRQCLTRIDKYTRFARKPKGARTAEETQTMKELGAELVAMTRANAEFSAVARCCLASRKLDTFIVRDEMMGMASAT